MSNKVSAILGGIVVVLLLVYSSVFIIDEREQGIVLRFGEIKRVETEPGLYFKAPLGFAGFDTVQKVEAQQAVFD
ncbi:MAG: protease modulator HflC, partial [Pseudomonadota bacterium]